MHTSLQWLRQNINQGLHSQKTLHSSPSQVSYGVSIVSILEKTEHVIMEPHSMWVKWTSTNPRLNTSMYKELFMEHFIMTLKHFVQSRSRWQQPYHPQMYPISQQSSAHRIPAYDHFLKWTLSDNHQTPYTFRCKIRKFLSENFDFYPQIRCISWTLPKCT